MNKEELKEFIKEMVKRKLKEATLGATDAPLQSGVPQDDSPNMSDSDKRKMVSLKNQQDKLNNDIRDIEKKKANIQKNLAKIAKEIESLQNKYAKKL